MRDIAPRFLRLFSAATVLIALSPARTPAQDWEEPKVEKEKEGRDEEARRRLMELETWRRKVEAEQAGKAEEEKENVRFDFSIKYKTRANSRNNFHLNNPAQRWPYDSTTFFDQRFQLQVDALYESLSTTFLLDKGNFVFDWKEDSEGTLERWSQFHLVNAALVRQLFAQYTGLVVVAVGRQNWDVGRSIVLEGPMDSVRLKAPVGKWPWGTTTVSAGYLAIAGGWRSYSAFRQTGPPAGSRSGAGSDQDGRPGPPAGTREEVFSAMNKLDGYYVDVDARPSRTARLAPYVLVVGDRGKFGDADLNLDKDFDFDTLPRDGRFEPLWVGLPVSADAFGVKLEAEAILLAGRVARGKKARANAQFLRLERDFGAGTFLKNVTAALEFGRGSGNDADDSPEGSFKMFNGLFLCRDRLKFGNIFSEDLRAGYFMWDSNLANITYLRGRVPLEPLRGVKVTLSATKLWTTEEVYIGRGPVGDWSRGQTTISDKTQNVGWEMDLDIAFPIVKRLDGFINFGYFDPGDVYARPDGRDAEPAFEVVVGSEFHL